MVDKVSRSEKKRLFKQVEELAAELADLGDADIKSLPVEEEVREEIRACRGLKGGAGKRQIKYLAKILREHPLDDVYRYLGERKGSDLKEKKLLHLAERWRDVIVNEAVEAHGRSTAEQEPFEPDYPAPLIAEALVEVPGLDEGDIRRLAHQYVRSRNKRYFRELYRMFKAALEMEERRQK